MQRIDLFSQGFCRKCKWRWSYGETNGESTELYPPDTDVFPVVAFRVEKSDNCINVRLTELLIIIIIIIIILSPFLLDWKTVGFFSKSVKKSVKRGANPRSGSIFVPL